jgi:hypothetical protein
MRHLGANFFRQFKNKQLMNMFKKLCKQNQQKKFEELWQKFDEFTRSEIKDRKKGASSSTPANVEDTRLCDLPGIDPPNCRRKSASRIKCFSDWIEKEPIEKWSLLHDAHGARYGIMTSNLAEVYNSVLRGVRGLPLVAIVESVLHGTTRYFQERYQKAVLHMQRFPATPYCAKVMKYMIEKTNKAKMHRVRRAGNVQRRFEISLRHKSGFGVAPELKTHEVAFGLEPSCVCTCNKPMLYHKPCSHVVAAAGVTRMDTRPFVSEFFRKEAVCNTWTGELWGYRVVGNFTEVAEEERIYIPDMELLRTAVGRRKTRRIRNDMDESELGGPTRQCTYCTQYGHRKKYCPKLVEDRRNDGEGGQG